MIWLSVNKTPRVEAVIDDVMAKHPRISPASQAEYYEEVHQHLAPLARELEREVAAWRTRFPEYKYCPQDDCVALR